MLRKDLGIDIGSSQTAISAAGMGILLKEPTVAAVDVDTGEVLEAGRAAFHAVEESPDHVRLCYPVWDPIIKCADILSAMLRIFLRRALGHTFLKPQVLAAIPSDLTEAQTNAVEDALLAAGAARVHLLEAPLCAALGAGFEFSSPVGQMLVHIGASRTEVAMIFLGDMVTHLSLPVGGIAFDSAIVQYLRERHKLYIGKRTAEQIKIRIGVISSQSEPLKLDVKGRDVQTKEPRIVTLSSKEMLGALRDPLAAILDGVVSVVEQTGDDMRADINKGGIMLTGGGILGGMDQFLADVTGIRTCRAANADTAAVEGALSALARLGK